jgi:transcriptional regulator with XRE-family HTH domain
MAKSFDELVRRTTTKTTRRRAAARTRELLEELLLGEIRALAGKSQREVAEALGIKQPSLSKLEKQTDMQISTLRRIVNALGGELEVIARFPAGAVKIEPFNRADRETASRKARGSSPRPVRTAIPAQGRTDRDVARRRGKESSG